MQSNIFIPETIKLGFQNRKDTYTQKLAYIIYIDEKGKLRKETSWKSWRDEEIEPQDFKNEPTSGFVLNKKAGGYSTGWNHRQTYVRVYDPRGFEFEIDVPNLLYILENTSSIKGKGLEGEFVYGWDGTELVLMPVDSPDYKEIKKYNEIVHANKNFKTADMIPGYTYLTKQGEKIIFIGKFHEYETYGNDKGKKKKGKSFYFYSGRKYRGFETTKSLAKIIGVESNECVENYADLRDQLEFQANFCPVDPDKDEYLPYTLEEVAEKLTNRAWFKCYDKGYRWVELNKHRSKDGYYVTRRKEVQRYLGYGYTDRVAAEFNTLEEMFDYVKPVYKNEYLANGKLYKEGKQEW
jgi:hypothetical protein